MVEEVKFEVGSKVYVRKQYGSGFQREAVVEKVYKNGRFRISGSKSQFTPSSNGNAHSGGGSNLGWQSIALATPAIVALWGEQVHNEQMEKLAHSLAESVRKCRDEGKLNAIRKALSSK